MGKCIRYGSEMVTNLDVKVDAQGYGIKITKSSMFGATIQKTKVAVCPSCGEISLYIQDTSKIEDYV